MIEQTVESDDKRGELRLIKDGKKVKYVFSRALTLNCVTDDQNKNRLGLKIDGFHTLLMNPGDILSIRVKTEIKKKQVTKLKKFILSKKEAQP